jgi:S-DNA-T family DNA segregation ATPase FtsK/SpoIIIE
MVAEKADGIAHALRCRDARVVEHRPGRIWLELHPKDVLSSVVNPLPTASRVDLSAVPVGRHEDGSDWVLRLVGTHVLVAGATGSGKGSVLWSLLNGLAPALSDGTVQVWALDPKGGMELRPGRPLFARFEDANPENMCGVLEQLVAVKDARAKALAAANQRTHVSTPDAPHILLVVDELATLTAFAERVVVRRIEQSLGILLTQGRACGLTVLAAVQDPGKDVVVWRDLFPTRIAMRLDNPLQVDMVLGDGASDMGARADRISELTPGVAYVRLEGTRALRRVRASYISDRDIPEVVRKGTRTSPPVAKTTEQQGGEAA